MTIRTMSLAEYPLEGSGSSSHETADVSRTDMREDPVLREASDDAAKLVAKRMPQATVAEKTLAVVAILVALFHGRK